jgi:hypothetical protein
VFTLKLHTLLIVVKEKENPIGAFAIYGAKKEKFYTRYSSLIGIFLSRKSDSRTKRSHIYYLLINTIEESFCVKAKWTQPMNQWYQYKAA